MSLLFYFLRENLFNTTFAKITRMKLNPFDGKSLMILSKDINPQVFFKNILIIEAIISKIFDIQKKQITWKARNVQTKKNILLKC